MNIECTALSIGGLPQEPTVFEKCDFKKEVQTSGEGICLPKATNARFGCLTANPKDLVASCHRPHASYPLRSFNWEIDDFKNTEFGSVSPPHVGPLDDPTVFRPMISVF